jgi:hypothetical protein
VTKGADVYESFEFSEEGNYIVVEKNDADPERPTVHFGEYVLLDDNRIDLEGYGIVRVNSNEDGRIDFSFTAGSGEEQALEGRLAQEVSDSVETDMFSKSWRVVRRNGEEVAGTENDTIFMFSRVGTYLVSSADRSPSVAQWRWGDVEETEFLYTWNNWEEYGIAFKLELTNEFLKFKDKTYEKDEDVILELVPYYE